MVRHCGTVKLTGEWKYQWILDWSAGNAQRALRRRLCLQAEAISQPLLLQDTEQRERSLSQECK